jgi:mannosyltransferase OCH1-like enzyme
MHQYAYFICVGTLFIIGFRVNACSTLISLLFDNCSGATISAVELVTIPASSSVVDGNDIQLIPKIIHQAVINSSIPVQWQASQQACIDLHPGYEYILWTDESARMFIHSEYSWLLSAFNSYNHPIQRIDSIRYFVIYHFGGIYLDLDAGCARRLDPLLEYPIWGRQKASTGITNDAMGSIIRHPFINRVIENL